MKRIHTKKGLIFLALVLHVIIGMPGYAEEPPYEPGWLKQMGSLGMNETVYGVAADSQYIYVTGRTNGALPGNTQTGSNDLFLAKYRRDGQRIGIRQIGAKGTSQEADYPCSINESSYAVAVDASGTAILWDGPTVC